MAPLSFFLAFPDGSGAFPPATVRPRLGAAPLACFSALHEQPGPRLDEQSWSSAPKERRDHVSLVAFGAALHGQLRHASALPGQLGQTAAVRPRRSSLLSLGPHFGRGPSAPLHGTGASVSAGPQTTCAAAPHGRQLGRRRTSWTLSCPWSARPAEALVLDPSAVPSKASEAGAAEAAPVPLDHRTAATAGVSSFVAALSGGLDHSKSVRESLDHIEAFRRLFEEYRAKLAADRSAPWPAALDNAWKELSEDKDRLGKAASYITSCKQQNVAILGPDAKDISQPGARDAMEASVSTHLNEVVRGSDEIVGLCDRARRMLGGGTDQGGLVVDVSSLSKKLESAKQRVHRVMVGEGESKALAGAGVRKQALPSPTALVVGPLLVGSRSPRRMRRRVVANSGESSRRKQFL